MKQMFLLFISMHDTKSISSLSDFFRLNLNEIGDITRNLFNFVFFGEHLFNC